MKLRTCLFPTISLINSVSQDHHLIFSYPTIKKALTRQARAFLRSPTKVKATRMAQQHLSAFQKQLVNHQQLSAHSRISPFFSESESINQILSRKISSKNQSTLRTFREAIRKEEFKISLKKRFTRLCCKKEMMLISGK